MTADDSVIRRFRVAAVCVVLGVVPFLSDPGRIAADTKIDLTADPWAFLGRSLSMWEPLGFFGQLQNQAYGYLFPMGPFFAIGESAGVPAWVLQRAWWSVLLLAAFLGVYWLSGLLGVKSTLARVLAGLAYALAPRMVTELGPVSAEVLPFAVAPWVLIPLVRGSIMGSPRRWAMLSGVALLCAGGINAVAVAAILPLPVWWLITHFRDKRVRVLSAWWAAAVVLATMWWLLPLFVLGRYSPPFLDWIESASTTTKFTDPARVLAGANQWVAYVADGGGPSWPAGWWVATSGIAIMASALLAGMGLLGISRSKSLRLFLLGGVLIGFVLVSMGHVGQIFAGLGAESVQAWLDGVLAPLRNTHKFDVILRLPLAIGVGFFVVAVRSLRIPIVRVALIAVCAGLLAAVAWPLATGGITRDRTYVEIPGYWKEAASWLNSANANGRTLVVPGASFGTYIWGRTQDEPLQALATSPWAVRDAVPLANAGTIRWLDAVQSRLEDGQGSPGLAAALSRAGVTYVLVRNDLDAQRSGAPPSSYVHNSLSASGGFEYAAQFGPTLNPYRAEDRVVNLGLDEPVPAIEIWRVTSLNPEPRATLRDATNVVSVSGASESVIDLLDANVVGSLPIVVDGDTAPENLARVRAVTDGFRNQQVSFGTIRHSRSETLVEGQTYVDSARVTDYLPVKGSHAQTVATYSGGQISASSSASSPENFGGAFPDRSPYAAIDNDPTTSWLAGVPAQVGQWWQVEFDHSIDVKTIRITWPRDVVGPLPLSVVISTDAGADTFDVSGAGGAQTFALPGPTKSVRVSLAAVREGAIGQFGISDVVIPTVQVQRTLVTSGEVNGGAAVFSTSRGARPGCALVLRAYVCAESMVAHSEDRGIRREFRVGSPTDSRVTLTGRWIGGPLLNRTLPRTGITAESPSVLVPDPASRPEAALDGDPATAWIASSIDAHPSLLLTLPAVRRISGLRLAVNSDAMVSRPLTVTVVAGGHTTTSVIGMDGIVSFVPVITDRVLIRMENSTALRTLDAYGVGVLVPVGISEITILGDPPNSDISANRVEVPCGSGPNLTIDGIRYATSAGASVGDVVANREVTVSVCGKSTFAFAAGSHTVDVEPSGVLAPTRVVITPSDGMPVVADPTAPQIVSWGSTSRIVDLQNGSTPRILETSENFNAGWQARVGEVILAPIQVDGWRQGWYVPVGIGGEAVLTFLPQTNFEWGLLVGLLAALALIACAAFPARAAVPVGIRHESTQMWVVPLMMVIATLLVGGIWLSFVALAAWTAISVLPRRWDGKVQMSAIGLGALVAGAATWQGWVDIATCGAVGALAAAAWTPAMRAVLYRPFQRVPGERRNP
jgi:arabinofuranan 3-O-arabinosyltransferase